MVTCKHFYMDASSGVGDMAYPAYVACVYNGASSGT